MYKSKEPATSIPNFIAIGPPFGCEKITNIPTFAFTILVLFYEHNVPDNVRRNTVT